MADNLQLICPKKKKVALYWYTIQADTFNDQLKKSPIHQRYDCIP